jgi:ribosomal protein S18 acetylase RimI-like enzyme
MHGGVKVDFPGHRRIELTGPFMTNDDTVVQLTEVDLPRLKDLCLACTDFYELVEGQPPTEATAAEILGPLEPRYADGTKHVWGIEAHGTLIAVAELLEGHPSSLDWYIGLLLVTPERRREGLGARFCETLLTGMATHGATTVRLVVHQQNGGARRFWKRRGFSTERELVKRSGHLEGPVSILVRSLGRTASPQ